MGFEQEISRYADVVKLAYTPVLEAGGETRASSTLAVRTTSLPAKRWAIVLPDHAERPPEDQKDWLVTYLRTFADMPDLADRVKGDALEESDLFFLRRRFPRILAFHGSKPAFRLVSPD